MAHRTSTSYTMPTSSSFVPRTGIWPKSLASMIFATSATLVFLNTVSGSLTMYSLTFLSSK